MNIKVFAILLLFAASCELVANPSDGLKDLLHKLAVKNSGNGIRLSSQSTRLLHQHLVFLITFKQRHLSEAKVPHAVQNITEIKSGAGLKDVRSAGWSIAPTAFLLLGSAVYICTLYYICL